MERVPLRGGGGVGPRRLLLAYWAALSFHGLSEQLPRIVHVALKERQRPARRFQGVEYRFVRLVGHKFFGFRPERFPVLNGAALVEIFVATPEKALLDSLEQPQYAGGLPEVLRALRRGLEDGTLRLARLLEDAQSLGNAATLARLGYVLTRLGGRGGASAGTARALQRPAAAPGPARKAQRGPPRPALAGASQPA